MSTHVRNTKPMGQSPRCGANTRRGTPCQAPAVAGKMRCRMQGGTQGSGAPKGNQNALKSGFHTRQDVEERRAMSKLIRDMRHELSEIEEPS